MQNNSNFIPIRSGKVGQILKKDTERLLSDTLRETDDIISNPNTRSEWRQKRRETYQIMHGIKDGISTIFADFDLNGSYGNPAYYPPVPAYTIPPGKSYTSAEIAQIHETQNNIFIRENIEVSNSPIRTDEMDQRIELLSFIDPSILGNVIIHEVDIDIITGQAHTPNFSYPEVTSHVGYMVCILTQDNGRIRELSSIYVYKNAMVIAKLLELLKNLEVDNIDNMIASQNFLSTVNT